MAKHLPKITAMQFAVLKKLTIDRCSGASIRQALARYEWNTTLTTFYEAMVRMERAGWLKGEFRKIIVGRVSAREKMYAITPKGRSAAKQAASFYTLK